MFSSLTDRAVSLETFGLAREIPEFEGHKRADYIDRCDLTTLFYDAFESDNGKHVIIVAPKAIGFEKQLKAASFYHNGKRLKAKHRALRLVHEIWIKKDPNISIKELHIELDKTRSSFSVAPNGSAKFRSKRVISTLCKDTPIAWIADWLEFHMVNHGVDGLILFENSDLPNHAEQIHQTIKALHPNLSLEVVHAPFKYGPPQILDLGLLQPSLWQLLRWKFTQSVEGLLVCDIDELVVCDDDTSLFDQLQNSHLGYFQISGDWVEGVSTDPIALSGRVEERRHHMFPYMERPPRRTHFKWAVIPSRIPKDIQFKIHGLRPEPKISAWKHPVYARYRPVLKGAKHYHLMPISLSWKFNREAIQSFDKAKHMLCAPLERAFQAVKDAKIKN